MDKFIVVHCEPSRVIKSKEQGGEDYQIPAKASFLDPITEKTNELVSMEATPEAAASFRGIGIYEVTFGRGRAVYKDGRRIETSKVASLRLVQPLLTQNGDKK